MKIQTVEKITAFTAGCRDGFLLLGCSKTGPEGPQGSQGTSGPQDPKGNEGDPEATGIAGATGSAGGKGPPGTANVIYPDWTKITFPAGGYGSLDAPKLADDIQQKGEISVFLATNIGTGATVYTLNYYANPPTWVRFYTTVGKITFRGTL